MSFKREISSIEAQPPTLNRDRNPAPYPGAFVNRNIRDERTALQQVEIANPALQLMEEPEQALSVIEEIKREETPQGGSCKP